MFSRLKPEWQQKVLANMKQSSTPLSSTEPIDYTKGMTKNELQRYEAEQYAQSIKRDEEWRKHKAKRDADYAAEDAKWVKSHGAVPGTPKWFAMREKEDEEGRLRQNVKNIEAKIAALERPTSYETPTGKEAVPNTGIYEKPTEDGVRSFSNIGSIAGPRGIDTPEGRAEYGRLTERKGGLLGHKADKPKEPYSQIAKRKALQKKHALLSEEAYSMAGLDNYIEQNQGRGTNEFLTMEYQNRVRRDLDKAGKDLDALSQPAAKTAPTGRKVVSAPISKTGRVPKAKGRAKETPGNVSSIANRIVTLYKNKSPQAGSLAIEFEQSYSGKGYDDVLKQFDKDIEPYGRALVEGRITPKSPEYYTLKEAPEAVVKLLKSIKPMPNTDERLRRVAEDFNASVEGGFGDFKDFKKIWKELKMVGGFTKEEFNLFVEQLGNIPLPIKKGSGTF